MRCCVDRQELAEAIGLAQIVVPVRPTRAVLANLAILAGGSGSGEEGARLEGLEIVATDLEVGVRVAVERVDVEIGGSLLLHAQTSSGIVRELGGDRVELEVQDGVCVLQCAGSTFRLVADDAEDYPTVPGFEEGEGLRCRRGDLALALRRTAFASADEQFRYALNGVLFEVEGSVLRLVATDGKRLAVAETEVENPTGLETARVVSNKAVQLLMKLGDGDDDPVDLRFTESQLLARTARATLVAQLVQGHFPPYRDVIPKDLQRRARIDTKAFMQALRRAALLTSKDSQAVRLEFGMQRLVIRSRSPGTGEGKVELGCDYQDDPLEVAYNPQYLLEALKVIAEDEVTIEFTDGVLPSLLRAGEGYRYVVMPLDLA